LPSDETIHVSAGDDQTVLKPNKVFEENLHREGEAIELGFGCDRSEVVIGVGFVPYIQRFLGFSRRRGKAPGEKCGQLFDILFYK
jgi:hypothetical protein